MTTANGNGNGNGTTSSRVLKAGVWAPIPTFFDDSEELDVQQFKDHVVKLAKIGMQPVVCGSMGEAFHLSHEERVTLFTAAREALDQAGLTDTVLIAGTGANNTRDTITLCKKAAQAGADVAIVICPGYYSGALAKPALKQFFLDVQSASPIPIMIYNFPAASGGIDLDSQIITEIAQEGSNICGVKLTCGAVGKLTRIAGATATSDFDQYPRKSAVAPTFVTLGGFADFLAPTVAGGRAHGAIMGLGNIYPRSLVHLLELSLRAKETESFADLKKAVALQDLVAGADDSFAKAGIAGTKWWLHKHDGYPNGRVRRPLLDFAAEKGAALEKDEAVLKLMEVEKSLAK